MKEIFIIMVCLLSFQKVNSQIDSSINMVETVISANRTSTAKSAIAQQVSVLKKEQIAQINAQSSADLLQNSGVVFVQKSQQGGGSPVLRGFEASRVLLVVDGVRMNNAIYRSGHLQNVVSVNGSMLERVELIFGPASTVYGTDALGGAVCFYTKNPVLSTGGIKTTGDAFVRYGSVNQEKTGHINWSIANQKWGLLGAYTSSDFGDLKMGKTNGFSPTFGKRLSYIERFNGEDSIVKNSNPFLQKFSGYRQQDALLKVLFKPNAGTSHILNFQQSTSSDVPRYDRLTDVRNGKLRFAEWYYGPQNRFMAAYSFQKNQVGWFNGGLQTTLSYQDLEESRYNRNFNNPEKTQRIEQVKVFSVVAHGTHRWNQQMLQIGVDAQYNDVVSTASIKNIADETLSATSTRYPDGGSQMSNAALYGTHQWMYRNWTFNEGLRVGISTLHAVFNDTTFFKFPYQTTDQQIPVFSTNAGGVWNGSESWRVGINVATGFRVPNIDDLGKVFDSAQGSLIVPNPDIKPEKTYNFEINVLRRVSHKIQWENVFWVTALRDAIVTDAFVFNGQSELMFEGVLSKVLANQNKRRALLWGVSSVLESKLSNTVTFNGSISYTRGRILNTGRSSSPLDHIPPMYGRVGLRWQTSKYGLEGYFLFNGQKRIEDYLLNGEDNEQYAPPTGIPAWVTVNLRGQVKLWRGFQLQAGIENLMDTQYRVFASGINSPGRNIYVCVRAGF